MSANEVPAPREHMVAANGLMHHVIEWSPADPREDAEAIVMCHGFLDLAWGFAALGPLLCARGLRVFSFDFRGHGESGRVGAGGYYYFPDYVMDMHTLIPQLVEEPFHLLGHSMGGTACTMFAGTHASSIRTLTLLEGLGPPGEADERAARRMRRWLDSVPQAAGERARLENLEVAYERLRARHAQVEEPLLRLLAAKSTCAHPDGGGLTWRFDPLHRTLSPLAFDPVRFEAFLRAIEAPTLLIDGEHGFRHEAVSARVALLRDVQRATIHGAGHMMHWTHAEQVAALVLEHLAQNASVR